MPKAPEDVLNELQQAIEEARAVKRQLHEEIQDFRAAVKDEKQRITTAIVDQVTKEVAVISEDARAEMRTAVEHTIEQITADWREKLGL